MWRPIQKNRANSGLIKGAVIISLGGFISKVLGAVYRIPLAAYLGAEGMGIYQLVFPLYCILLTVSSSGIPTGMAKIISSGGVGAERKAFSLYGTVGFIGSLLMFALSGPLAAAQGEEGVALACKLLSPSVFFVAIISVVRGYFQGMGQMFPTALSEVLEQSVKAAVGVFLAGFYRSNAAFSAAAAVAAVTVSEGVTCLAAVYMYLTSRSKKPLFNIVGVHSGSILAYTVPLTLMSAAMPISQLAESVFVVNILRGGNSNATSLYGIYSGCAVTLINLPVSVCYGFAAAVVPQISSGAAKGDIKSAVRSAKTALLYTAALALPFVFALYAFAPLAARIIFPSLTGEENKLLISLVRIMCINALSSSLLQTSSACITSLGKPVLSFITQWLVSALRVGLSAVLVSTPLSVSGAAYSANVCYLVAVLINLCYIIVISKVGLTDKEKGTNEDNVNRIRGTGRRNNPVC